MSNFDGRVVASRTMVSGASQTYFSAFRNEGATSVDAVAYGRCCHVPGVENGRRGGECRRRR